ncbi:septum site-determining protein MinC [Ramlibacter tataouinensis]|uniref:Probable septum site-determining protein MinC n=1 Tax=Ramlibacter tataouinensis (strain ATCC BAA-407 / DSM 14655 / LMG 21543 / TTB310) TaxID=365046 RepID=F5Y2C2_RAMTT|nr:septum site-determining protein MinC [Ramlibacter tataouinensis]AEG91096.1 Candidate septum formation inhibitor [Ramlibacter tataouinensis TTB310]
MTIALAGRTPATFEIKSATLPLVSLLLKSADLAALGQEMQARFGDIPDFFDNDPLVIDLSPLHPHTGQAALDFNALLDLLRLYRVMPVAVKGGSEAQMEAALKAGLAPAGELMAAAAARKKEAAPARPAARAPAPPAPVPEPPATSALVIDKPLRSGQQVYARGRDLVVMSMVNPGAEVIADGHIHVYAPLRGKAIAGARGNADARILSLCLEPELISIAGVYRTSEVPLPAEVRSRPTQVRLVGGTEGKLVMDRLHT